MPHHPDEAALLRANAERLAAEQLPQIEYGTMLGEEYVMSAEEARRLTDALLQARR